MQSNETHHDQADQVEVKAVDLSPIPSPKSSGKSLFNGNIHLIGNVKVKVQAVVGETEISVAELFGLTEGSSIKLDVAANAPIELFLEDKLIAKGDLVVIDEHFGIQITEIRTEQAGV